MEIAPLAGLCLAMAALDAGPFGWLRADTRSGQAGLRADPTRQAAVRRRHAHDPGEPQLLRQPLP